MSSKTIGLIAAMPDEVRPLLRRVKPVEKCRREHFTLYRFLLGGAGINLVESGMGPNRAARAADALAETAPAAIVSFGFGGAVLPGLEVGDLVVGVGCWLASGSHLVPRGAIDRDLARDILDGLGGPFRRVAFGQIITSREILAKKALAPLLPREFDTPVLDMETAAVAEIAERRAIPLVALRAVSDDAREELSFTLDEFTDRDMNIRGTKVLATILRKPWIVPQLIRLARNTHTAGATLADAVIAASALLARRPG
ncbi:phosphorylase [Geobacter sp.]|uniref:phosphorylase family protein n=1 Tax=Geobacter sp. TaxID=46610 RepID=UPI0026057C85|nr:phosphorylase [Geobacter sp.]